MNGTKDVRGHLTKTNVLSVRYAKRVAIGHQGLFQWPLVLRYPLRTTLNAERVKRRKLNIFKLELSLDRVRLI